MLLIPEAHYIAETEQMQSCNEQHPAESTCATFIFFLRIFGRKGTLVKKKCKWNIYT